MPGPPDTFSDHEGQSLRPQATYGKDLGDGPSMGEALI